MGTTFIWSQSLMCGSIKHKAIKSAFRCPEEYKDRFKDSKCLLTISVGQEVHEGETFAATIDLINRHFKSCTILVDDSLQRHTMQLVSQQDPNSLYQKSMLDGDLWLKRNKVLYKNLTIPYNIIRWNKWLNHKNYSYTLDMITAAYKNDVIYKTAFDESINNFLIRFYRRSNALDLQKKTAEFICLQYLAEECAALCLWTEEQYDFEVYPNKRNLAMSATHAKFIAPIAPHILNPVAIKFKNRKQLIPQKLD